jgi:Glycosyltransferase Maf N-terminal domain
VTMNGKLLCSSFDPIKEAQSWVKKNEQKLNSQTQIVVLGAGCGYHLTVLAQAYRGTNIIVIEKNEELIDFCKAEHGLDLAEMEFVHGKDIQALKTNRPIKKALKKRYAVLTFYPACSYDLDFFNAAEELLLGRVDEGLQFILSQRDDLQFISQNKKIKVASRELISIKTLMQMVGNNDQKEEIVVLKALRELVN